MKPDAANKAALAALPQPPPGWLSQDETCRRLNLEPRRLNEMIERGEGPDKVLVKRDGKRPAPWYSDRDVERLERAQQEQQRPQRVFAADSGVGPELPVPAATAIAPAAVIALLERLIERRPPDRGPFLSIAAAARDYGIPRETLRFIVKQRIERNDPDVYRTAAGKLRVRRSLVAEFPAQELHQADLLRPRRRRPPKNADLLRVDGHAMRVEVV